MSNPIVECIRSSQNGRVTSPEVLVGYVDRAERSWLMLRHAADDALAAYEDAIWDLNTARQVLDIADNAAYDTGCDCDALIKDFDKRIKERRV